MIKSCYLVLLLFLVPLFSFSQKYSAKEIREDVAYLKRKLEKVHPNAYRYTEKTTFEAIFEEKTKNLPDSLTVSEAYQLMAELMHYVHDAHTAFYMGKAHKKRNKKEFPFRFFPDGEKIKLRYNLSKDSTLKEGMEVVEMNGKSIEEYIQRFEKQTITDYGLYGRRSATLNFWIYYTRNFGTDSSFSLTLRSDDGETLIKKTFDCVPSKEMAKIFKKRYPYKSPKNLNIKWIDSLQTAVLTINSFRYGKAWDIPQWGFNRQIHKVFDSLQQKKVNNLIIDVRGNRGGFVSNPPRVIRRLYDKPFTLTDTVEFKKTNYVRNMLAFMPFALPLGWLYFKPNRGEYFTHSNESNTKQKPIQQQLFKGNLFFLMDSESYSATSQLLSKSHNLGIGTYIGEPCGGAYWGCYALQKVGFKLPNTRFEMLIPTCKSSHKIDFSKANGKTLQPDYYVVRQGEHWWNGKNDKVLEKALDLVKKKS
ncbi:MAG: S41 family peptidase [Bacteroidia bacterium]